MTRELEVKLLNIDVKELEKSLIDMGATLIGKEIQTNITIDSSKNPVKDNVNGYLRIRESKDLLHGNDYVEFTLKEKISSDGIRDNVEYNIPLEEADLLLAILEKLGYDKIEKGIKNRTSYELEDARFDIDIWDKDTYPFPYAEVEVKESEDLDKYLNLLNIPKDCVSTLSINELKNKL